MKKQQADGVSSLFSEVGLGRSPGCFMCECSEGQHFCVTLHAATKEDVEAMSLMFERGARLNQTRVIIGACKEHAENLNHLNFLITMGSSVAPRFISEAKAYISNKEPHNDGGGLS